MALFPWASEYLYNLGPQSYSLDAAKIVRPRCPAHFQAFFF